MNQELIARLKQKLTPEQFDTVVNKATEQPFTGTYLDHKQPGTYNCVACNQPLFTATHKYDSGSGWPSFYDVIAQGRVELKPDHSLEMKRVEVTCANCGAHLGHVFDDGPTKHGGKRYCINSTALNFEPE